MSFDPPVVKIVCGAGSWMGNGLVRGVAGGKVLSQSSAPPAGTSCVLPSNSKTPGWSTPDCAHELGAPNVNMKPPTRAIMVKVSMFNFFIGVTLDSFLLGCCGLSLVTPH